MRRRVYSCTVALALLSVTGTGHAADPKVYTGAECVPAFGQQAVDLPKTVGAITNLSADERFIVCPIVRDNVFNLNGTKSALVNVYTPGATLTCDLFSMDQFAVVVASRTASTSGAGNQTLNVDVNASASKGMYGISCGLPEGGQVFSYRITEY